jgi:hypothetical protein
MRPILARRRSTRNRSLCSDTFRRNNSASVATGVKLTPHSGGVGTKTSENPAFLEDRYRTVLMFRLKERQHEARENPEAASGC